MAKSENHIETMHDASRASIGSFSGIASAEMRSWFDIAAFLYFEITKSCPDEERFTSFYFGESGEEGSTNPNLKSLMRLAKQTSEQVQTHWNIRAAEQSAVAVSSIQSFIDEVELQDWGERAENEMTPYYAVLLGIDMACQSKSELLELSKLGPMNKGFKTEDIGVYLKPRHSYIDSLMAKSGTERLFECKINDLLQRLVFLKNQTDGLMKLPRIVNVNPPTGTIMPSADNPLRLGIAAFSCEPMPDDTHHGSAMKTAPAGGATIGIKYAHDYDTRFQNGIARAIYSAVSNRCHLLVFPEIVITSGLRRTMQKTIAEMGNPAPLSLIVAGSAWENGNNVCHLLDGWGHEIGTYHKRSPFSAGASESRPDRRLTTEALANPGASCTLANVKGLGLVLPSICKDLVSEDRHTVNLARTFRPLIVCCPANSASLDHAFEQPTGDIVERSLSMVALANHCGSRRLNNFHEIEISRVSAPGYAVKEDGTFAETHQARIESSAMLKTTDCELNCNADGSCLFIADIDYQHNPESSCILPIIDTWRISPFIN